MSTLSFPYSSRIDYNIFPNVVLEVYQLESCNGDYVNVNETNTQCVAINEVSETKPPPLYQFRKQYISMIHI